MIHWPKYWSMNVIINSGIVGAAQRGKVTLSYWGHESHEALLLLVLKALAFINFFINFICFFSQRL